MDTARVILLLSLFWSVSCNSRNLAKNSEVRAPSLISDSFVIPDVKPNQFVSQRLIGIRKDALEKEFLFQGSLVFQVPVPMFNGLQSRVVAFRIVDDSLYMLETNSGHVVNSDIPANLILARFPIVSQTADSINFDFNKGMSKLFVSGDWKAHEYYESSDEAWSSQNLGESFVDSLYFNSKNQLAIHQVAQIHQETNDGNYEIPVELVYYLSTYEENENFEPTDEIDFDRMGFFGVKARFDAETGVEILQASKFDESKGITYGISANTPDEYKQAVRDGILYWNKAFGEEVVSVVDLDPSVSAPSLDHNVVQWVNWDDAGFAYADAQMDPRSGEILHAQVFLTSAFAFRTFDQARDLLRRIKEKKKHTHHVGVKGFGKGHLCDYEPNEEVVGTLTSLLSEESADDQTILRISQDIIRQVVSHEVGHTLGLRHNFAGSNHANYKRADWMAKVKGYIRTGHAPKGLVVSSSVMDYQRFEEDMLVGDQVANLPKALEYDEKAIRHLYFGKKYDIDEVPLFCTDSHVGEYLDCQRFDAGNNFVEGALWDSKEILEDLPYMLLSGYLAVRSFDTPEKRLSIKAGSFSGDKAALVVMSLRYRALTALKSGAKFLAVERQYDYVGANDEEELANANKAYAESLFQAVGGVEAVLEPATPGQVAALEKKFVDMVQSGAYDTGVAAGGSYKLTQSDKDTMIEEAHRIFQSLEKELVRAQLSFVNKLHDLAPTQTAYELEGLLEQKARHVLMHTTSVKKTKVKQQGKEIDFVYPSFFYSQAARMEAVGLLSSKSEDITFGAAGKAIIAREFSALLNNIVGGSFDVISTLPDYPYYDREFRQWIEENKRLKFKLHYP